MTPKAFETWAQTWSERHGSALDLWMPPDQQAALYRRVTKGAQIRSATFDADDDSRIERRISTMARYGWRVFADERNGSSAELIFIRSCHTVAGSAFS